MFISTLEATNNYGIELTLDTMMQTNINMDLRFIFETNTIGVIYTRYSLGLHVVATEALSKH